MEAQQKLYSQKAISIATYFRGTAIMVGGGSSRAGAAVVLARRAVRAV